MVAVFVVLAFQVTPSGRFSVFGSHDLKNIPIYGRAVIQCNCLCTDSYGEQEARSFCLFHFPCLFLLSLHLISDMFGFPPFSLQAPICINNLKYEIRLRQRKKGLLYYKSIQYNIVNIKQYTEVMFTITHPVTSSMWSVLIPSTSEPTLQVYVHTELSFAHVTFKYSNKILSLKQRTYINCVIKKFLI